MTTRLDQLPPDQADAWYDGYQHGITHGIQLGRAQIETEDAARWAAMRATIHHLAQQPDYTTLAERRGNTDRATQQRRILAERGIA